MSGGVSSVQWPRQYRPNRCRNRIEIRSIPSVRPHSPVYDGGIRASSHRSDGSVGDRVVRRRRRRRRRPRRNSDRQQRFAENTDHTAADDDALAAIVGALQQHFQAPADDAHAVAGSFAERQPSDDAAAAAEDQTRGDRKQRQRQIARTVEEPSARADEADVQTGGQRNARTRSSAESDGDDVQENRQVGNDYAGPVDHHGAVDNVSRRATDESRPAVRSRRVRRSRGRRLKANATRIAAAGSSGYLFIFFSLIFFFSYHIRKFAYFVTRLRT